MPNRQSSKKKRLDTQAKHAHTVFGPKAIDNDNDLEGFPK